jgi:putative endonuclease
MVLPFRPPSTQPLSAPLPAEVGRRAEAEAARFLRRERGFKLLARNWRNPRDRREEIDLIARDGAVLVFVEVKARSARARVPGFHAVDGRKRDVLRRACRAYLGRLDRKPRTFRLDVVEVEAGASGPVLRHYRNIPLFSKYFRG